METLFSQLYVSIYYGQMKLRRCYRLATLQFWPSPTSKKPRECIITRTRYLTWISGAMEMTTEGYLRLSHLHFPHLERISVSVFGPKDKTFILRYLQPSLRTLWSEGRISHQYSTQIRVRRPGLQEVGLHNWASTITPNDLLQFLNDMPSLTTS